MSDPIRGDELVAAEAELERNGVRAGNDAEVRAFAHYLRDRAERHVGELELRLEERHR